MTTRSGAPALIAAGLVAAGLVAAWFLPPLAIAVAWPMLLFLPGWALLALVRPRIDGAGRIGLAVVISVVASTHLVHVASLLVGGYGRGVVFGVAAVLGAFVVAVWVRVGGRPPRVTRGALPAAVMALLAMGVVGLTLGVSMWRTTPTGISSGGTNWSDLGVHLSIAETLNAGAPFPPDVPYFAGEPLVYHWFADLGAAILARAADLFSIPAMVVQSTVLAGALALLVFSLARRLVRVAGARRVATLAAALAVFAGGFGWTLLIRDVLAGGDPLALISTTSYDNQWLTDWPYFRIPSVMGTGLLAHRATTAGLPIVVGAILVLVAGLPTASQRHAGWRDRPALLVLAGSLGALLAPFHFFFFPVVPLLALAWVVAGGRLLDRDAPRNAAAFLAPYVLAIPFAIGPALQAGGSDAVRLVLPWPSAPVDGGIFGVIFFYLTNLGLPFGLALIALTAPGVPRLAFLGAWVIGLFVVPNVVQVSVIDFDMNKYFQAMWIAVAILAAWFIHRWPWPAIAAVVVLSVPSPLLVAAWTATSNLQVASTAEARAAEWVRAETPPNAIFVTDNFVNALTDAAGRRRLTTFGPYIANLGFRPDERIADVTEIYCGGDAERSAALMREHGATYVIDGNRPQPCPTPTDFGSSPSFELVYDAGPLIWRLAD